MAEADAGQETFSPEEYYSRAKDGWKNDPKKVRLIAEPERVGLN